VVATWIGGTTAFVIGSTWPNACAARLFFDQWRGVIAMLEEAEAGALLFSSGMAAATAVFGALDPGDHIVAVATKSTLRPQRVASSVSQRRRAQYITVGATMWSQTKLVWLETPSNPLWTVTDIAGAAEIAHAAGARLAVARGSRRCPSGCAGSGPRTRPPWRRRGHPR
jgi:hypothetical protein